MSLVINHNSMSANVARNLNSHYAKLGISTQRLSTGQRVNSAADDAAGLAIRELQRSDIAALHQGARNANDAISLIQVADGSLSVIDEKLIRMRELAEQAATGTYSSTQRLMIESEYQQMASEISRIANSTDFNGIKLLDGTLSGTHDGSNMVSKGALKVHFGTGNDSAEDYYYITIGNCTAEALGVGSNAFEWGRKPIEMTQEAYEKLRDESAQKVYDKAYAEKFDAYYDEIYTNLTTGTPPHAGLPVNEAAELAREEARKRAEEAATQDMNVFKASADKTYEESYNLAYRDAYLASIAAGKTEEEAAADGARAGIEAGIKDVRNKFDLVQGGATSLLDYVETTARDAIFNDLFTRMRALAINNTTPGGPNLTAAQQKELDAKLTEALQPQAERFSKQLRAGLEEVYTNPNPGEDGWDALNRVLEAGRANGTAFSAFAGSFINLTDYQNVTIPAFAIQDANGNPDAANVATVTNATAQQQNINALYTNVSTAAIRFDEWPPRNRDGADLLIDRIKNVAYDVIYDRIYNGTTDAAGANPGLFQKAVAAAAGQLTPPNTSLNATQILEIHTQVDAVAKRKAEELAENVSKGLQRVYSLAYEGVPAQGTGFNTYYNEYLQAGNPKEVARQMAEARASRDGWDAMEAALNTAQNAGTQFQDPATSPAGFFIDPTDLQNVELPQFNIQNADRTGVITVAQQTITVDPADLYQNVTRGADVVDGIGALGNKYLDEDGLLSKPDSVIAGAAYYMDVFDNGEEAWVPTKGNNLLTQENAQHAITAINSAIETKDKIRAHLGALQNRFENTITNLNIQAENLQNAESRISDVDVATEMTAFVRQQILTQTAVAMLAQANSLPQMASQLIGG